MTSSFKTNAGSGRNESFLQKIFALKKEFFSLLRIHVIDVHNKMITEELIARFFKKECTAEEAEYVAAWLHSHPEVADQYLNDEAYNSFSSTELLSIEAKEKARRFIHQKMDRTKKMKWLKRSAVAASVVGCIALSLFLVKKNKSGTAIITSYKKEAKTNLPVIDTEYNFTHTQHRVALADGSLISLSPQSFVWFSKPFGNRQRDIHLQGEACFKVAKNKQKPFTVFAGDFATTALGTEFIVKQNNNSIRVQLLHGKVVITKTNSSKKWKNIYLLPGEQMICNAEDAVAKVSEIKKRETAATNKLIQKNNTQSETADSLFFNGTAMQDVLQKLHSYYGVNIQFSLSDVKHISFTGTIGKKDSVESILNILTQMNGLTLEKSGETFIISKQNIEQ